MLLILIILLAGLTGPVAIYAWGSYAFGSTSVHATAKLLLQGRFSYKSVDLIACSISGLSLIDFHGRQIYRAEKVRLSSASWSALRVDVQQPYLNLLADESGLLYVISLLQKVGFIEEQRASHTVDKLQAQTGTPESGPTGHVSRSAKAALSGQIFASILQFNLSNGILEVPEDFGPVLGRSVRIIAAAGSRNVETLSGVVEETRPSSEANSNPGETWKGNSSNREPSMGQFSQEEGFEGKASKEWWKLSSVAHSTGRTTTTRYPILCHVKSETLNSTLQGWRTGRGVLLAEPISSSIHFTQELAKFALSRLHPLLGYAAELEGTDFIRTAVIPLDMHLPCEMISLRLKPLKVRLKTKALVKGLAELLKIIGRKEWAEARTLEAWTSGIAADVYRSGLIDTKRMDILVGHDVQHGDGLHMLTWGQAEYAAKDTTVDMQFGLPYRTLTRLGCKDLDEDLTYFIAVKGSAVKPEIDWLRATKHLLEMITKSNLQKGLPFLKNIFRRPSEKRKSKDNVILPPPTLPLPWEAFSEELPSGSAPNSRGLNEPENSNTSCSAAQSKSSMPENFEGRGSSTTATVRERRRLHQGVSFPSKAPS